MSNFLDKEEQLIYKKFLKHGYIIEKTNHLSKLDLLQNFIVEQSSVLLDKKVTQNNFYWLNNVHDLIKPNQLNQFRLQHLHCYLL